eukprot:scaffold250965_cov37-Prasinocladus_malaysianus.AAC.3
MEVSMHRPLHTVLYRRARKLTTRRKQLRRGQHFKHRLGLRGLHPVAKDRLPLDSLTNILLPIISHVILARPEDADVELLQLPLRHRRRSA